MNLHQIIAQKDVWLIMAIDPDGYPNTFLVEASTEEETTRIITLLEDIDFSDVTAFEIVPTSIQSVNDTIDNIKIDWGVGMAEGDGTF